VGKVRNLVKGMMPETLDENAPNPSTQTFNPDGSPFRVNALSAGSRVTTKEMWRWIRSIVQDLYVLKKKRGKLDKS
jgi:hypothetical protein